MNFICPTCGKHNKQLPAIGFKAPFYYDILSDDDKKTIAKINSDLCEITHEDQTDRFIRAVLIQKIYDCSDTLHYGIWVSLSEKSFDEYVENFDSEEYEATYFGYISSEIPGYDETLSVKANVVVSKSGNRPEVIPHEDQDNDFVNDYYTGISRTEAEIRIQSAFNE
jgi:hypothetical protein